MSAMDDLEWMVTSCVPHGVTERWANKIRAPFRESADRRIDQNNPIKDVKCKVFVSEPDFKINNFLQRFFKGSAIAEF